MRIATATTLLVTLGFALACGGAGTAEAPLPEPVAPPVEAATEPAATQPAAKPAAKPSKPATAKEYPGTAAGLCQRLSDCGCPPLASVKACTTQMDRELAQARRMMAATGMSEMVNAMGGGDVIQQSLYVAANSHCKDACDQGTDVDFGGNQRVSSGSGVTTRSSTPDGGGTSSGSWSVRASGPTGDQNVSGSVDFGSDIRMGGRQRPSSYTLVARSLDGEWLDIKVDGKTAIELRNSKDGSVKVSPGTHTVEVFEFMDDERALSKARITTGTADQIVIGVGEERPVECYDPTSCTPL